MKTSIKLVLFYLGYQLLFAALMAVASCVWPVDSVTQTGCALLLSGLAMTWHLVRFGYVNLRQALRPVGGNVLLCSLIYMAGAIVCCNGLNGLIPLPDWMESDLTALGHTALGVFCLALLAPLLEELLFRGAVMQSLSREGDSPWRGIVLSALLFGLIHMNPAQVFFAFLMGLAFGWITVQTRSLLPVIAGHVLNNSLSVVEIAVKGNGMALPEELPVVTLLLMAGGGLLLTLLTGRLIKSLVGSKLLEKE